jgi:apolipoprotein N-acyltransferase
LRVPRQSAPLLISGPVALASGAVLALAYEPVAWFWLAPFSVAALVLVVRYAPWRRGALLGWLFSAAHWFMLIWWMRAVGPDAYVALATFMSLYGVLLGAGLATLSRLRWWPVWSAVLWMAIEVLRGGWPFGGFPWARLAFATIDTPVAPALAWVGSNGVSLLVALMGTSLALVVAPFVTPRGDTRATPRRHVRHLAVVGGVVGLSCLPALISIDQTDRVRELTVAAVQGNVPGNGDDVPNHHREITASHATGTAELAAQVERGERPRPDFVVWPENSTAVDPFLDPQVHGEILAAVSAIGVPVLVGGMVDAPDPEAVLNQGIVWDPVTGPGDRYTKHHPVPFGEYIPYRKRLDLTNNFGKLRMVPFDMMSGTRVAPLRIDGALVADAICFDIAYDDGLLDQVRDGAQLLVVQTSNALFIHTHQIEQQWAISRLRAIETGRYVVVAAINGISGVIAPDGSVVDQAAPRTQTTLVDRVALFDGVTLGTFLGPWLGKFALLASLVSVAWGFLAYRRADKLAPQTEVSA